MPSILYITQVHIESGAIKRLAEECQRHGIHKPLVVTDMGIRQAGLLQRALDLLAGVDVVVYDQTPSNPTEAAVRAATALCREHHCDGLIALGGGSSMDCAKGVAIAATHDGPLTHYATIEGGLITIVATSLEGQSNYRTIEELQSNLDPDMFWRVHRSYLVNIHRIKEVIPWFKSSFQLRMDDKKQSEVPVSRVQTKRLRALLKL